MSAIADLLGDDERARDGGTADCLGWQRSAVKPADAAFGLATHLLLRSGGPHAHPRWFAATDAPDRSLSWAKGLSGILTFFRRLADGGPERLPVFRY